jgi:hypothetical protein
VQGKFIQNRSERHVAEVRITTQALTFAVAETFSPNQTVTIAVDTSPTIVVIMFAAMETSSVDPAGARLVVEATITTQVPSGVAVASCIVHHLLIIAVVPLYIGLLHRFAATITSDQNRIHPTPAVVLRVYMTTDNTSAATVIYVQNHRVLHVVEQSTTIPLLVSVVGTSCFQYLKVLPAVDTRTTTQASKDVVIAPHTVDITSFKYPRTVIDSIGMTNGHGHLLTLWRIFRHFPVHIIVKS